MHLSLSGSDQISLNTMSNCWAPVAPSRTAPLCSEPARRHPSCRAESGAAGRPLPERGTSGGVTPGGPHRIVLGGTNLCRPVRRRRVIELEGLPELVDPVLIAAFEGWNDAGEASSGVLAHLETEWKATPLVELDPEDYYDFQVTRPILELGEGLTRSIIWPTTRLLVAR